MKDYKKPQVCDITLCESECTKDFSCKAFDFTMNCKTDSCRLYQTNNATTEVGDDKRMYCEKTDGKIDCKVHQGFGSINLDILTIMDVM